MKVMLDFVPDNVPAEREAVELGLLPMRQHGVLIELVERSGASGHPVITLDGPPAVVTSLLHRGGYETDEYTVVEV